MVGHIRPSNFVSIRCTVLEISGFEFLQIWLEMPIYAPKISGLGVKSGKTYPSGKMTP